MGPAVDDPSKIRALIGLGVDIFRLNVSHGQASEHARRIERVRRIARRLRKTVAILVDLPGPKFRLGKLDRGSLVIAAGQSGQLVPEGQSRAQPLALPLRQDDLLKHIREGQNVFINDGTVKLEIVRGSKTRAAFRVLAGGVVRSGSGINLPQTDLGVTLPVASDLPWIQFAAEHTADWLAVSFVQTANDVAQVRRAAGKWGYRPSIMAKIEKRRALQNLDAIIQVCDGVMVARGDLGVETPLEEIPFAQKRIIAAANRRGKFSVTATQMLESMVTLSTPTRAEVTDIANAVLDGTDGVMLSAETAVGQHPIEAVSILSRVVSAAERHLR